MRGGDGYRAIRTSTVGPDSGAIACQINDERVHTLEVASMRGTGVGIVAAGTERFEYDDFTIALQGAS